MLNIRSYLKAFKENPVWFKQWIHRPPSKITPGLMAEYSMFSSKTLDQMNAAGKGMNALSMVFAIIFCAMNILVLNVAERSLENDHRIPTLHATVEIDQSNNPTPQELPNWLYLFLISSAIPHMIFTWKSARAAIFYRKIKADDPIQKKLLNLRLKNPAVSKYLTTIERDNDLREFDIRIVYWLAENSST
jgi:hypothetical protein